MNTENKDLSVEELIKTQPGAVTDKNVIRSCNEMQDLGFHRIQSLSILIKAKCVSVCECGLSRENLA